ATQISQLLAKHDLTVSRAVTGAQAIELLEKEPARVVLTELVLPDTMGIDLLKALERLWPGLPVVMMGANASVTDAMAALRAGASDFVQKPINADEMMFAVNKALTVVERRAEQPPPPS